VVLTGNKHRVDGSNQPLGAAPLTGEWLTWGLRGEWL